MTKQGFMDAYRKRLIATYEWATDAARLDGFMASVEKTLTDPKAITWNKDGETCVAAWRDIGGKGKPTYKALKALA